MKTAKEQRITETQNLSEFLNDARDLLGFIRVENEILADDGHLSLNGLYMRKMMMLKDLEDKATALAKKSDSDVVTEGIALLFQVQKELNTNAQKHLEILSRKNAHGTSKGDLSDKGGHVCH
tara:strand:- start:564 stop:929 length:366 start_codon:yes stop_codon:yes gene_type:complete